MISSFSRDRSRSTSGIYGNSSTGFRCTGCWSTWRSVLRASEATFLGYIVSSEGSRPLEEWVAHPMTTIQLHRFMGMLKCYRLFLPHAMTQARLHDTLSSPVVKGFHPVTWLPDVHRAFEDCKARHYRKTLSNRTTCTRHRYLHFLHGCRAAATCRQRLAIESCWLSTRLWSISATSSSSYDLMYTVDKLSYDVFADTMWSMGFSERVFTGSNATKMLMSLVKCYNSSLTFVSHDWDVARVFRWDCVHRQLVCRCAQRCACIIPWPYLVGARIYSFILLLHCD
jgi:hypothetical protein